MFEKKQHLKHSRKKENIIGLGKLSPTFGAKYFAELNKELKPIFDMAKYLGLDCNRNHALSLVKDILGLASSSKDISINKILKEFGIPETDVYRDFLSSILIEMVNAGLLKITDINLDNKNIVFSISKKGTVFLNKLKELESPIFSENDIENVVEFNRLIPLLNIFIGLTNYLEIFSKLLRDKSKKIHISDNGKEFCNVVYGDGKTGIVTRAKWFGYNNELVIEIYPNYHFEDVWIVLLPYSKVVLEYNLVRLENSKTIAKIKLKFLDKFGNEQTVDLKFNMIKLTNLSGDSIVISNLIYTLEDIKESLKNCSMWQTK